jgi:uncharacterized HAD superfamily protein
MRLGIDLDGVVADFTGGWIRYYDDHFGTALTTDLVTSWDAIVVASMDYLSSRLRERLG